MNTVPWSTAHTVPFAGLVIRWLARRNTRRWPAWWSATLDSGRRSQDLWTAQDWRLWGRALTGVSTLDQALPMDVRAPGLGWPHPHASEQRRYQRLNLAGYTPLCLALRLRDPAPFQALLDAGASPSMPGTPDGETPLVLLAQLGTSFRDRRWSQAVGGATPQPWHSLMLHKLTVPAPTVR